MGHKHKKEKRKHRSRSRSRSVEKERERERERDRDRERERERERSKHRHHKRHHKEKRAEKRPKEDSPTYISSDDDCIVVPPPPKISRQATPPPPPPPAISNATTESSSGAGDSLSIEETNRIRAKLGLKPLQVDEKPTSVEVRSDNDYKNSTEKTAAEFGLEVINDDLGEFVHKPADNLAKKVKADKLKEKLAERRAKRAMEQKLSRIKKLGESSSDEDESATSWIEKNRKVAEEKAQAEKRAKLLQEMDEEFGVGDLVAEEMKTERRHVYGTKDLKGLRVEHDLGSFGDGKQVILTLKDQGVLEEDGDVLVNVNMVDDEHHKKNIDRRKQKPGYNAYDDEEMDTFEEPQVKVLSKYDEEIDGEKKKSFTIGVDDSAASLARKREEAQSVKNKLMKKRLETLAMPAPKLAAEYYNEEEISTKFKKIKKVKKVRKKGILKADDLVALTKEENTQRDFGSRRIRSRVVDDDDELKAPPPPRISAGDDTNFKDEPMEIDVDDLPPLPADIATIKVEPEEDLQLELALKKARRLMQRDAVEEAANVEMVARSIVKEELQPAFGETEPGGSIVLNSTAEFCRTLGDIPTYGLAGNRDEDAEELLDFEREMIEEQRRRQEEDGKRGAWNEVEGVEEPPEEEIETTETPILDPEPDLGGGMAGALRLAVSKGYLEKEIVKRPSASRFAHLQAQNYSIEDKSHAEDDKFGRRERYAGPTSEFKDKDGYKPNVKLDYIDDEGHVLNAKEAFRYLSHRFHGKGPGKNKVEKRMKKKEQDVLMKQMSSTDTPLGTLNMLQAKQKETQSPFIVLSGGKHQTATISKTKLSK